MEGAKGVHLTDACFSVLLLFVCLMEVMMGGTEEGKVLSLSVFALLHCVIYTAVYGPTFPIMIPLSRFLLLTSASFSNRA